MADRAFPLGDISNGSGSQVARANALFDALSPIAVYGLDDTSTAGLYYGYHGGKVPVNGAVTVISDGVLALSASATNYIEATPTTGAVSKNTTGYTPGRWRIGRAVTDASSITNFYDDRFPGLRNFGLLSRAFPSDANYTLTAVEADNDVLSISAGVITATRDWIVPLIPRQWTVINKTAQSVRIIGASGTGITIATGKTAIVMADGTNIVRVTADT